MAVFNIPQFLDTEDKLVGPFTAKQLGWTVAASATLFLLYIIFSRTVMIILAIPVLAIFGGLAFYKPEGRPLSAYVSSLIFFFLHPKMYTWKRLPDEDRIVKKARPQTSEDVHAKKQLTEDKIREISQLLNKSSGSGFDNQPKTHGNITFK